MAGGQWDFDGKGINVENIDSFSLFNLRKIIIAVLFMEKLIRYIASDGEAVSIIHDDQGCAKSPEDMVADMTKLLKNCWIPINKDVYGSVRFELKTSTEPNYSIFVKN
jgi:hypothetical protein